MNRTGSDAGPSKPVVWSTTVEDWGVRNATADSKRVAGGKSDSAPVSLVEMIVQEITGSLERGDTVRLSSFASFEEGQSVSPKTGHQGEVSPDREMVFRPSKRVGFGSPPSPGFFAEPKSALRAETENYEVAKRDGALAHIVVVPKDDPLGSTVSRVVERVPEIARIRRKELTEKNIDALVELYLADDPVAEARRAIETDNARERARFLSEVACLTSKEIAQNAGHQAANASVTGSRWKQQGRIFSVPSRGSELYPAFQFREGQPHPAVAKILRELPKQMSPWQIAFWFNSSNGWLRGAAPADRLDDEEAVVKAAHRESEPIVG
jgi:nucleoid DNA-binding protein